MKQAVYEEGRARAKMLSANVIRMESASRRMALARSGDETDLERAITMHLDAIARDIEEGP